MNASSIGMAKAALQAINDIGDLFGDGSNGSIVHVLPDEIQQCSAALCNMVFISCALLFSRNLFVISASARKLF